MIIPIIEVEVDLNVRCGTGGQLTFSGFTDVRGDLIPAVGTMVLAVEPESDLATWAVVVAVNKAAALVYLAVAWREMRSREDFYNETAASTLDG